MVDLGQRSPDHLHSYESLLDQLEEHRQARGAAELPLRRIATASFRFDSGVLASLEAHIGDLVELGFIEVYPTENGRALRVKPEITEERNRVKELLYPGKKEEVFV